MNVTCQQCNAKLNIPDDKIDKNRDTKITCPKCGDKIIITAKNEGLSGQKKPIRFALDDRMNAIICIGDAGLQKSTHAALKQMGYDIDVANDADTALGNMEYHVYPLIIMDETFDQNLGMARIIEKINDMDMLIRRRTCLVLFSSRYQTNDNMSALHTSVNNILNIKDVAYLENFLVRAVTDHANLYKIFNETLKMTGKA